MNVFKNLLMKKTKIYFLIIMNTLFQFCQILKFAEFVKNNQIFITAILKCESLKKFVVIIYCMKFVWLCIQYYIRVSRLWNW